ncbi:Demethylrebeccamycin-D-glucose O-methyltransferase [Cyphellophora attinorum]|uniref:Demethylrebeccamycin-D-glucose O-methyltransferase n=1 Tax=Cyphellophora attinorum TaxID=1664694 RepID=A0A0N1P2I3_9EURO|nr:Demethylrebeccamycin-D-glucose O-methyltransferase [Phialophora attinorum]KPI43765.1 Demethylrebeccamycin-D-glucose O-methyltransferase [Phialophora attinorum]
MSSRSTSDIVASGYNTCHADYTAVRSQDTAPELCLLTTRLPSKATILDIGCGSGVPVASSLTSQGFHVTGFDISASQIAQAKINVPAATFFCADMLSATAEETLAPSSFDAVVAMFSIFHTPREQHGTVLDRIAAWLRPGGYLLMTTVAGSTDDQVPASRSSALVGEVVQPSAKHFYGVDMYWSSHEDEWYRQELQSRGVQILAQKAVVAGHELEFKFADSTVDEGKAKHPLLFAKKAPGASLH